MENAKKIQQAAIDHPYELPIKVMVDQKLHKHHLTPNSTILMTVYVQGDTGWWHVSMSVDGRPAANLDEDMSKQTEELLKLLLDGAGQEQNNKFLKGLSYQLIRPLTKKEHEHALAQLRKQKMH